ncbi:Td thymidylate synthase [Acinetobacter phage 133]|uniref:thymidylate synthase n=1 Tax=Acinetobacter phage 133 TaxID=2919552 RepID=D9I6H1_9CAUD|nr:Td thymidylate synthase [Acinetobacter phage 133]ADJ19552.1 Td thymidylate synthase [Acinetobacter phage 133]
MKSYLDLMRNVLDNGEDVDDERTGVGTIALFGEQLKIDLRKGFPAVTTKRLAFKSVTAEMLWFLRGSNDLFELRAITHGESARYDADKKTIWDANYYQQAEKELGYTAGYMGPVYGNVWREFGQGTIRIERGDTKVESYDEYEVTGFDQIKAVLNEAIKNPGSRRLLTLAWDPKSVWGHDDKYVKQDKPTLPPCHYGFQININNGHIDLLFLMRSVDVFLGKPFDIASYAELCHVFGRILGKTPRYLIGQFGNVHIYKNHIDQCLEQLSREPKKLPTLWINPELKTLDDFEKATVDDFKLIGYESHPNIKADMAV